MEFIIVGCGKFGQLALDRLRKIRPSNKITAIDIDPRKVAEAHQIGYIETVLQDSLSYLVEKRELLCHSNSWIIPTVPFHLLARIALGIFCGCRLAPLPGFLGSLLPNAFKLDNSTICCSYADFVCPDDCEEGTACTVTGEERKPLYMVLKELEVPGSRVLILISRQLCPGIGGYQARDFFNCIDAIEAGTSIIGTSCRCHAILTAVERRTILAPEIGEKTVFLF